MIRALTLIVALATSARTDAVLCSSFVDEDTCSGCTSEGECVWDSAREACKAVADSPNCTGDIGITNVPCSSLDLTVIIMTPPMQELVPRVQTQMNKNGTFEPAMLDNMYPFLNKEIIKKIRDNLLKS